MNKIAGALIAYNAAILSILWGLDLAIQPACADNAITGSVVVTGSYHSMFPMGQNDYQNYQMNSTNVTVNYTIATKTDSATGKMVFDTSDTNSVVMLQTRNLQRSKSRSRQSMETRLRV